MASDDSLSHTPDGHSHPVLAVKAAVPLVVLASLLPPSLDRLDIPDPIRNWDTHQQEKGYFEKG